MVHKTAACIALLIGLASTGCDDGNEGDGDADADTDVDADVDGDGDADADADTDADADPDPDWDATYDAEDALCSLAHEGEACEPDTRCTWINECVEGACECVGGFYDCSEVNVCGEDCPQPAETHCGDSCDLVVTGCLCRCGGGGPNYSTCACSGGSWQCGDCE